MQKWKAWEEGNPDSAVEYTYGPYPEKVAEKWVEDSEAEGDDEWIQENPWNIGEVRVPYHMDILDGEPLLARGLLYHRGAVTLPDRSFDFP